MQRLTASQSVQRRSRRYSMARMTPPTCSSTRYTRRLAGRLPMCASTNLLAFLACRPTGIFVQPIQPPRLTWKLIIIFFRMTIPGLMPIPTTFIMPGATGQGPGHGRYPDSRTRVQTRMLNSRRFASEALKAELTIRGYLVVWFAVAVVELDLKAPAQGCIYVD